MDLNRIYFELPDAFCIEVLGADAVSVVNNLCTNNVAQLEIGASCEMMLTNLRGWVVAHGIALRTEAGIVLVGQHPSPSLICEHIDRYIIREDAQVAETTKEIDVLLVPSQLTADEEPEGGFQVPIAIEGFSLVAVPKSNRDNYVQGVGRKLSAGHLDLGTSGQFEALRVRSYWPRSGREIVEKTLPQELDRDEQAISFTKGCYLGQETVARLDARGQLQKKLCLIELDLGPDNNLCHEGDRLTAGEQEVGTITSIADRPVENDQAWYGLAVLKRGFFEAGTDLMCGNLSCKVKEPVSPAAG